MNNLVKNAIAARGGVVAKNAVSPEDVFLKDIEKWAGIIRPEFEKQKSKIVADAAEWVEDNIDSRYWKAGNLIGSIERHLKTCDENSRGRLERALAEMQSVVKDGDSFIARLKSLKR